MEKCRTCFKAIFPIFCFVSFKLNDCTLTWWGFVKKKSSSNPEFITVEIKKGALRIRDILQAKLYEDIFNAKFSFAISPKGISTAKLKVILEHDKAISRGKVIIAQCSDDGRSIWINPLLKDQIPKAFKNLCRFNKWAQVTIFHSKKKIMQVTRTSESEIGMLILCVLFCVVYNSAIWGIWMAGERFCSSRKSVLSFRGRIL